ncbi:xanthine dehydrogenase family protein molybdopterin-binding subunit [Sphingobacterium sp.]|uniref:xanthine dehydrogenase family protein molybdopterin-binding subunit n=1 Tax=Sphingobacterium sp. TaxID=341027 RepID=UPI002896D9F3|nr:xanthine dehydrogenase family protein molybdopterin-binding subunit [Sphingobacterium sp.]
MKTKKIPSRQDGRAKVTGAAKYTADYHFSDMAFGVLVGSTISKGRIASLDTKAAQRAPGVITVISHVNPLEIPAYDSKEAAKKGAAKGNPLHILADDEIFFYDQPIALVIADTFERAFFAAKQIKATYQKDEHQTDLEKNLDKARMPSSESLKDYIRGEEDGYKKAEIIVESDYYHPIDVHNPMELANTIAHWTADDRVTIYTKTQGVDDTQRVHSELFKLPLENVTVDAEYVGGAFGMGLRRWPYEMVTVAAAKKIGRPLKVVLHREQMFTNVGYRPETKQHISIGATKDGKLVGITHHATANISPYHEFTEAVLMMTQFLYACPNVTTRYRLVPLNISNPIWMRGPGEATGSLALECAMDELAHKLDMDPIELRLINYADKDPVKNVPWTSKFLKECYEMGAQKIGWENRRQKPRTLKEGDWLVGYGVGTGTFGSGRAPASVQAILTKDGQLTLKCAVNDMGPGTATMMAAIATEELGIDQQNISVKIGHTDLPPGPTQGGSVVTTSVGAAVYDVCQALKTKLKELAVPAGQALKDEDIAFVAGGLVLKSQGNTEVSYPKLMETKGLSQLDLTVDSKGPEIKGSKYSYSVHFVKLRVHSLTGQIKIDHVVSCADGGKIISPKTAASQMIGGAVGGIGMALMEDLVVDHRYGKPITNNLADYHVPVNADIQQMDALFVDKKDPVSNAMGTKGVGEIALIGVAPAVANAIFNATGKRVRELPITPEKLI